MSALQAVWPVELMRRRARVLAVEKQIRCATGSPLSADRAAVTALRAVLAGLPCAHWNVMTTGDGYGSWGCVVCQETIAVRWVRIADQEQVLRRASRQRAVHRAAS